MTFIRAGEQRLSPHAVERAPVGQPPTRRAAPWLATPVAHSIEVLEQPDRIHHPWQPAQNCFPSWTIRSRIDRQPCLVLLSGGTFGGGGGGGVPGCS